MNPRKRTAPMVTLFLAIAAMLPISIASAQDAPFTGVVTDRSVEIRSGAGLAFYTVGELQRNQVVQVEEVLFNNTWYKIRVPEGIYSYISKAFVDAQGDGTTGVINSAETEVLAASLRGPGVSYRVQRTMNRGDKVKIVAEEGNYYKVVPPKDAFVFIKAGTLREATAADMVPAEGGNETEAETEQNTDEGDTEGEGEPAGQPSTPEGSDEDMPEPSDTGTDTQGEGEAEGEAPMPEGNSEGEGSDTPAPADTETEGEAQGDATEPAPADTDDEPAPQGGSETEQDTEGENEGEATAKAPLPPAPDVEVSTPARSDALIAVELAMLPYNALPLEERPLDAIEQRYREVRQQNELGRVDQQIVEIRLRAIERQRAALETILASRKAREKKPERETPVPSPEEVPEAPKDYSAVGTLTISTQYNGVDLPQLYRIAAPSGRTIAYVEPTDAIDSAVMLGKIVGVVGPSRYDPALKLHIISVEDADVLTTQKSGDE